MRRTSNPLLESATEINVDSRPSVLPSSEEGQSCAVYSYDVMKGQLLTIFAALFFSLLRVMSSDESYASLLCLQQPAVDEDAYVALYNYTAQVLWKAFMN